MRIRLSPTEMKTGGHGLDSGNSTSLKKSPNGSIRKPNLFWNMIRSIVSQTINLWKPPHLYSTFIVCSLMFCFGSSYYALMLWFPELFQRFAEFEISQPGEEASVCKISSYNQMVSIEYSNPSSLRSFDFHFYFIFYDCTKNPNSFADYWKFQRHDDRLFQYHTKSRLLAYTHPWTGMSAG